MVLYVLVLLQVPGWLFEAAIRRTASLPALLQLLESPTAAAAADLACIAAALRRIVDLQQQSQQQQQQQHPAGAVSGQKGKMTEQQQQQAKVDGDSKATEMQVRQCCQLISALAAHLPAVQQQQQGHGATQAADAASIVWATAQLQHKDSQLSSSCLQLFAAAARSASAADAAAVVTAMAAAGRALPKVFSGCSKELMQQVLQQCTARLLGSPTHQVTDSSSSSVAKRRDRTTSQQLSSTSDVPNTFQKGSNPSSESSGLQPGSSESLLLGQRLLQLHSVLQLPPGPAHLQQLLAAAADEEALAAMKDNAATAALVASLAAVAELSQLPPNSSSTRTGLTSATAAAPRQWSQQKKGRNDKAAADSTYGVWGPQQQMQQLLQQLLLDGLLPRLGRATAKQVATSLEAVAQLAGEQAVQSVLLLSVELPLARDFARGLFTELLAPTAAAAADTPAAAAAGSDDPDMRSQWNQSPAAAGAAADAASFLSGWKGEHVAAVAAAALQLGVAHPAFFEAVASDILLAAAAVQPATAVAEGLSDQQQQQQRRRSRLEKVTLQHLVEICCCAPALHCRVEQLLAYTTNLAAQQLAASAARQQQQQRCKRQQQQQQLAAEDLLLLAWCAAEMDVPQLLQPAVELVTAGMASMQAAAGPNCLQQQQHSCVAGRLFQLHVWMSDRQQEQQLSSATAGAGAAASVTPIGSDSSRNEVIPSAGTGLADVLSTEQLQHAHTAWLQLQTAAPGVVSRLGAVADGLQQLPGLESLQMQSVTSDGSLVVDLEARVQGIPVAVLLLDDADEQQQQQDAKLPSNRTPAAPSSSRTGSRLQDSLCSLHTGDLMFRARALAARGYWVVVVSWQQWLLLDGFLDAEVDYLQSKLWLLEDGGVNLGENAGVNASVNSGGSLSSGDAGVSSGMPVAAAAASSEVLQVDQ
jgi:hypothetical protein